MREVNLAGWLSPWRGLRWWLWFRPDPHCPSLRLINIERSGLSDQIAQFSIAISARVEVGGDVREALPHRAQADPAIFRLHLHDGLVQDGNGRARRLQGFGGPLF